jgi:phosphate transport system protein
MSREAFNQTLEQIKADVVRMGATAERMVEIAVEAAITEDVELAKQVLPMEIEVDAMEKDILERVVITVGLESPVARDLLRLKSTLGVIAEIEKAGDDACKLARRSMKLTVDFPEPLKELLLNMGSEARSQFRNSVMLYSEFSTEAADGLVMSDESIDQKFKASRRAIVEMMAEQPDNVRQLLRCFEIFHALEHIADHAVYIAKSLKLFLDR